MLTQYRGKEMGQNYNVFDKVHFPQRVKGLLLTLKTQLHYECIHDHPVSVSAFVFKSQRGTKMN